MNSVAPFAAAKSKASERGRRSHRRRGGEAGLNEVSSVRLSPGAPAAALTHSGRANSLTSRQHWKPFHPSIFVKVINF